MTQETFDQIVSSARRGDVFVQAVLGKMLCEGKVVHKNLEHGLGGYAMLHSAIVYGQKSCMMNSPALINNRQPQFMHAARILSKS